VRIELKVAAVADASPLAVNGLRELFLDCCRSKAVVKFCKLGAQQFPGNVSFGTFLDLPKGMDQVGVLSQIW
jgi:hypothetical protein